MVKVIFATLASAVVASDLSLTWSDCGAKHAKTTDVSPTTLTLGTETAITGTGTVDEDITGGTYDMELKAGGGLIDSHFTGNNCEAKSFNLPLGLGKLDWDGIACPMKAGTAKIGFHVTLASSLPAALATSDITLNAGDQNAESVLCVQLHLAKTMESTAGACSADDQSKLSDPDDIGKKAGDCGKSAYSIISGKFDHDKFNTCLTGSAGISSGCSECYAVSGDYGASNCKAACLLGWCKSGCLDCVKPVQGDLDKCTGFTSGSATPCMQSTAGACSADDQSKLADGATVGKAGSDCGLKAYNIITGAFNHDKFNSCFVDSLKIASGCSECYATNGEFAAKNCKAACLLGWCKQGCLDCSTADAPKAALDSCTGFTSGSADPCMDDIAV